MASASSSQHRCVFVGNIPYDATEEQLIDICREVGPVVSFRLVIDRDTGKPKGYGFCEYKDEETALSARRNLQGYEINGRQLRVDFAENDKNSDKNREQGRGGPGLVANVDPHKQVGGSALTGESSQHQPIGLHIAMTAATVMAGTLGGAQTGMQGNQNGLQGQSAVANDPLTFHLAKMSRSQLNEVISELKVMATQNREAARQLLLARPQLPKAIFQAQIMLGMVTPQMLQMPNIRQPLGQPPQPMLQDTKQVNSVPVHTGPGLPSLAPRPHPALVPKMQEGPGSALLQPSLAQNQFSATIRHLVQSQTQIPQQATLFGQSGVPPIRPAHPSVRPQILGASSPSVNQQTQSSFLQHPGKVGIVNIRHNSPMVVPNADKHASLLARPSPPDNSFRQSGLPTSSGILDAASKDTGRPRVPDDALQVHSSNTFMNLQTNTVHDSKEPISRPSKLLRLDDGRGMPFSQRSLNASDATTSGASQMVPIGSVPPNLLSKSKELQYSERQVSQQQQQQQLTPDVESGLLQQVLNLTPEQLSSLPPEQQQEVIQLQQALRRDQLQPS